MPLDHLLAEGLYQVPLHVQYCQERHCLSRACDVYICGLQNCGFQSCGTPLCLLLLSDVLVRVDEIVIHADLPPTNFLIHQSKNVNDFFLEVENQKLIELLSPERNRLCGTSRSDLHFRLILHNNHQEGRAYCPVTQHSKSLCRSTRRLSSPFGFQDV